jgi:hypothetical protein
MLHMPSTFAIDTAEKSVVSVVDQGRVDRDDRVHAIVLLS